MCPLHSWAPTLSWQVNEYKQIKWSFSILEQIYAYHLSLSFTLPFRSLVASDDGRMCTFLHPSWGFFTYLTTKLGSTDTGKRFSDVGLHNICTIFLQPIGFLTWRLHETTTVSSRTEELLQKAVYLFFEPMTSLAISNVLWHWISELNHAMCKFFLFSAAW